MTETDRLILWTLAAIAGVWILIAFAIVPIWRRRKPHHPCPYCAVEIPVAARICPACKKTLKY